MASAFNFSAFRGVAACLISALLLTASAAAQQQPAADQTEPDKPKTLEERLRILPLGDKVLRGAQPAAEDVSALAKEKGVSRIICLLDEQEMKPEVRQAAEQAGMTFGHRPLAVRMEGDPPAIRLDLETARKVIEDLKPPLSSIVYVYDESGRDRGEVIDLGYHVLVENESFADALLRLNQHDLTWERLPGLVNELKRLAAGIDELPTVEGMPISDRELFSQGETVTLGSVRLNVKRFGEGPALYVIHGGPGESHKPYRPFLDALAGNRTLVYYDQRGCGQSSRPQFLEAYTLERLVEELDGLRQTLGHEKISLIGHSSGGILSLRYALEHPERVDRMVIVSTWASAEQFLRYANLWQATLSPRDMAFYRGLIRHVQSERRTLNDAELAKLVALTYPSNFFGRMTPELRQDWNRRSDVSAFSNDAMGKEVFGDFDIRDRLDQIKNIPTLVIVGRYDIITPPGVVKPIADNIPGAKWEVFERSGHLPFVEQHDQFIETVESFLNQ